jgi:hypothetical protein
MAGMNKPRYIVSIFGNVTMKSPIQQIDANKNV